MDHPANICDQCFGFRQRTKQLEGAKIVYVYCRHSRTGAHRGEFRGGATAPWQLMSAQSEEQFEKAIDLSLKFAMGKISKVRFGIELLRIASHG